jgi:hypothetical protein
MGILHVISRLLQKCFSRSSRSGLPSIFSQQTDQTPRYVPKLVSRYSGPADPPPMRWKACHPSTRRRFKAELTCPFGHGITLKGHSVSSDGSVKPSVVCRAPGCTFHEIVQLRDWDMGEVA